MATAGTGAEASTSYSIADIAREAGVTTRTLRAWHARKLFKAPAFSGPATRYTNEHRLRILAIQKLRADGMRLPAIHARVAGAPLSEIEAILSPPRAPAGPPPEPTYVGEKWERVVLVPGLEVHVNAAGGPILRRMAQEILTYFGGQAAARYT